MKDSLIDKAIKNLHEKISILDIDSLTISAYNRRYFKDYVNNFYFFMPLYKQLLYKSISKLDKPIGESVFVDYGGGCGILSFLAVELGFKEVVYNDVYEVSTNDTKEIANRIDCNIQHYITGDIKGFTSYIHKNNISIDLLCSFDVLEHIYNLKEWFKEFKKIKGSFSLCFMTSANASNPYINRALRKIHYKAEYKGSLKKNGWKERDSNTSFLEIRKQIITRNFPNLDKKKVAILSKQTRGLYKPDIIEKVKGFIDNDILEYHIKDKTNTCDPMTGNWAEHIIDLKSLKSNIIDINHEVRYTNSYYSYSKNKLFNIPKFVLNKMSSVLGDENLFFSPSYTLEVKVKK